MPSEFQLAAGSVVGAAHRASGRNNQDALCTFSGPGALIGVVADGCGSSRHSELGAQLGARLTVEALRRHLPGPGSKVDFEDVLERTRLGVLAHLGTLAIALGSDLEQTVESGLLFTLAGAVVTAESAWLFGLGDGVFALNGHVDVLSFPGNAPPYLGYALLPGETAPRFAVHRRIPTDDLTSLLIGTDGLVPLLGPDLRQLWEDDRYFRNPQGLSRRLTQLARETSRIDWEVRRVERERGRLTDDATLVLMRRRREPHTARRP